MSPRSTSLIKAHLDQYVIDQEEAKRILSVAVYNHYKRLAFQAKIDMRKKMGKPLSDKIPTKIQKSNIIMVGPSGSGKTYILKSIAEYLGVSIEDIQGDDNQQKENPTSVAADEVDELDKEALNIMHQLPPEKRAAGLAMLRGLLNN